MKQEVVVAMKNKQLVRIRFSIGALILLTSFSAWFIRSRVSPALLAIKVNPNGSFEHDGKALSASAILDVLQNYHTKQKWCLSRSILKIVSPGNFAQTPLVDDAMDYIGISACSMQFDQVTNEWYTASNLPTATFSPDPQLAELVQRVRAAK